MEDMCYEIRRLGARPQPLGLLLQPLVSSSARDGCGQYTSTTIFRKPPPGIKKKTTPELLGSQSPGCDSPAASPPTHLAETLRRGAGVK